MWLWKSTGATHCNPRNCNRILDYVRDRWKPTCPVVNHLIDREWVCRSFYPYRWMISSSTLGYYLNNPTGVQCVDIDHTLASRTGTLVMNERAVVDRHRRYWAVWHWRAQMSIKSSIYRPTPAGSGQRCPLRFWVHSNSVHLSGWTDTYSQTYQLKDVSISCRWADIEIDDSDSSLPESYCSYHGMTLTPVLKLVYSVTFMTGCASVSMSWRHGGCPLGLTKNIIPTREDPATSDRITNNYIFTYEWPW